MQKWKNKASQKSLVRKLKPLLFSVRDRTLKTRNLKNLCRESWKERLVLTASPQKKVRRWKLSFKKKNNIVAPLTQLKRMNNKKTLNRSTIRRTGILQSTKCQGWIFQERKGCWRGDHTWLSMKTIEILFKRFGKVFMLTTKTKKKNKKRRRFVKQYDFHIFFPRFSMLLF